MSNIITNYLAREILKTSAATVLILFIILISNALGRLLADVADGDIPHQALWPVLLGQGIGILSMLLPIGIFLGIVFAFGRMYKDHEIVVMNACGVGYGDFYKPVAWVVLPIFFFSIYTSIWLSAQVQRHAKEIVLQEQDVHEFQQIKAGQFNQDKDGERVVFMESISDDRLELHDIIISEASQDNMIIETARSGRQQVDPESGDLFLVVGPGERFEGQPGQANYRIIEYDRHGILLESQKERVDRAIPRERKTPTELWVSQRIEDRVELQWRIAIPFVLLTLAILAVPLAYIAPRQGRFGKVGYAILVFIAYLNLLAITRGQLEKEVLPMAINFWWIHLLFLVLAGCLLWRRNRGLFGVSAE